MSQDPSTDGPTSTDERVPERLDSWKDIASYLKRDVSTVQRWERLEGLPVHRHRHDKRGSVHAFRSEVDAWFRARLDRGSRAAVASRPAKDSALDIPPGDDVGARSSSRSMAVWAAAACIWIVSLVAAGIVGGLTGTRSARQTASEQDPHVSSSAQQEYLLGRHLMWKFIEGDRVRAMEHFSRAIALAPEFGAPYAGLAHAWWSRGVMGALSMRDVAVPARDAAERALALDDRLGEAYAAKAYVQGVFDWDWTAAEATIRRGIAADPDNLETHYVYALLLMALGRLDQAIAEIDIAARLDPLSAQVQSTFGRILWRARRLEAAVERLHRAIELEPRHAVSLWRLGDVYEVMGRYEDALETFERARALDGQSSTSLAPVARVYARMGREHEARALVSEPAADILVALNEPDRAFERLSVAIEQRHDWPIFIKRDPLYDGLHGDPRWNALLRRMNLPID